MKQHTDDLRDASSGEVHEEGAGVGRNIMLPETLYWKRVALWLADCHAANGEYDARLKSVSKSRRDRFGSICHTAAQMLRGQYDQRPRIDDYVLRRLDAVVERLIQRTPESTPGALQDKDRSDDD